jgi:hypothetical protein
VEIHSRARQATDDNILRRMRFACWITKATNTNSENIKSIAFPVQEWLGEGASVLRYSALPVCYCCFDLYNALTVAKN